jgi:hypothetical protein
MTLSSAGPMHSKTLPIVVVVVVVVVAAAAAAAATTGDVDDVALENASLLQRIDDDMHSLTDSLPLSLVVKDLPFCSK